MLSKSQLKRRLKIIIAYFKRKGLLNTDFTIISNNCWGGMIYDEFHLPYLTPTIGCWIPSEDYIKFISNLDLYLSAELNHISIDDCHVKDILFRRKEDGRYKFDLNNLVIGRIMDVDIIFLHYHSFEEAKEKWNRRCKRVNYNNLIVKFNDQNDFREELYYAFCKLDFKRKLFFTVNDQLLDHDWCYLFNSKDDDGNVNDTIIKMQPFNIKVLLNNYTEDRAK